MLNLLVRKNERNNVSNQWNEGFFDEFFNTQLLKGDGSFMKTDLLELENHYQLDIEIPGFDKNDIKISLKDGYLTVEASKKEIKEENQPHYLRKERYYGNCSRTFYVGNIKEDSINANYVNGILSVTIGKEIVEETKKYITIK